MTYVNAPVHDMLIRIKNAYMARRTSVRNLVFSTYKTSILDLLQLHGYIVGYEVVTKDEKKFITIAIPDVVHKHDILHVKFFSLPSRPWYVGYKSLFPVAAGKGIGIISTNQGLMDTMSARKKKVGGELIAEIY